MAKVLVVGGAGYVGSATCAWLLDHGHSVWVLDHLSTGRVELLVSGILGFTHADAGDFQKVCAVLDEFSPDCVMHFAAKSLVTESIQKPQQYFENNVIQTQRLLEAMLEKRVRKFVFSSTCAIFGDPGAFPMNERCPKNPINPYGQTKLQAEQMMAEFAQKYGLQAIALRYFNASGADPELRVGEWHDPETHLIPRILSSIRNDQSVDIYGDDYPTADGTCVRDYVHVFDLAAAHESAMSRLLKSQRDQGSFEAFNLGSETGYSVKEMIQMCEQVTNKKASVRLQGRRPGDPPRLVADSTLAQQELGFGIQFSLDQIIQSAWQWEKKKAVRLR